MASSSPSLLSSPHSVLIKEALLDNEGETSDRNKRKEEAMTPLVLPPPAKTWTALPASRESLRTSNPIRNIVDPIMASYTTKSGESGKEFISLALGDPTTTGSFSQCPILNDGDNQIFRHSAGYVNALGTEVARETVARWHSSYTAGGVAGRPIDAEHVILASGCSGALDLALRSMLDPGSVLLVPNPGFPLYEVIAESIGAKVISYRLDRNSDWEVDLEHVQQIIETHRRSGNGDVRGILINNPSNPTGHVFCLDHLMRIVKVCNRLKLPIIADEIYGNITFHNDRPFIPLANVVASMGPSYPVPVIVCSGIGKQFLVPGYRVGWVVFYDNDFNSLEPVEQGARRLAQIVLGASHPAQAMTTKILKAALSADPIMVAWQEEMKQTLRDCALLVEDQLKKAPGLKVCSAQGTMYTFLSLEPGAFDFLDQKGNNSSSPGEAFASLLLKEEEVFVLPGICFGTPDSIRVVFCSPKETLQQATERIIAFCVRHYVGQVG